jgi:hypothetical protein
MCCLSFGLEKLAQPVNNEDNGIGQQDHQVYQHEDEVELHRIPPFQTRTANARTLKNVCLTYYTEQALC